jgi:hypothetical protein
LVCWSTLFLQKIQKEIVAMEIVLKREVRTDKSTIGKLIIDEGLQLCTLEDVDRGLRQDMSVEEIEKIKVYGKTAIPAGRYKVTISYSRHFKKLMPLLIDVPGFDGIRMHYGNTPEDTLGCILVGESKGIDMIYFSRKAYEELMNRLQSYKDKENIYITIN